MKIIGAIGLSVAVAVLVGCARDRAVEAEAYEDRLAKAHEADTAEAAIFALEPGMPVEGGPVTYTSASGRTYSGYEVTPQRADSVLQARGLAAEGALPGIILVHEWWGLDETMRGQAERLAGEGYRVLAVDLFNGMVTNRPAEARGLAQQSLRNREDAMVNLVAAYAHLSNTRNAPRVAVFGYCFGGAMALNAGLAMPDELDAMVIYYGDVTADAGELQKLNMPILGIFGAEDESVTIEEVRAFEDALAEAGREAEVHVYENAGHAFANPSGEAYHPDAAGEAWQETRDFLATHLYDGV